MADKQVSARGLYILALFTFINFAALICITVYHVKFEQQNQTLKTISAKDVLQEIWDDFKQDLNPGHRRNVDDINVRVLQFLKEQRYTLVRECTRDVVNLLSSVENDGSPSKAGRNIRQASSAGNELANIFSEIAKSEVDILSKHCNNGSFVCMPGQKGEPGNQGIMGPQGPEGPEGPEGPQGNQGPQGPKGDMGAIGPIGPKGDNGTSGRDGAKGDKGDMGPQGSLDRHLLDIGPIGLKGEKGEPGTRGIAPNTQCCNALSVPTFLQQMETIRVLEGTDITMHCNASGYPPPSIVWTPTTASMDMVRTVISPSSITIRNSQTSDGHFYTCTAQNALGNSVKQFIVHVYKHIKFDEVPLNYTVMLAKPVTLECMIEGPLSPAISWYKVMPDGSRMLLTNNITPIVNGSQLHIDHVTTADTGEYICEGHNGIETVSKKAYIHTYGPPHIIPPGTVHATAGQSVVLKCDTDSLPASNITWKYPPGVTNAYKETDGTLMVLNASPKDSTYFICIATNPYGTAQATLQLKVDVPPKVVVIPQKINMSQSVSNLAIECKASGAPPLSVQWYKDGQPLVSNGHYLVLAGNVLLVNQATTADIGKYTCKATNSFGAAQGSALAYQDFGTVSCGTSFKACKSTVCSASCPTDCAATTANLVGYKVYTQDSSICLAGIQSGAINNAGGGLVTWSTDSGIFSFPGSVANGLTSLSQDGRAPQYAAVVE